MTDALFLQRTLEEENKKYGELQEECAFLSTLILKKHFKNLSEAQYATLVRRKNM
jgi:DNA-binding HxlR family transcriptional regulator